MLDIDIRLQALVQNVVETNKPMLTTSQNDLLIITPESDMTQIENYYHQILDYATASSITNLYLDDYDQNGAFKCLGASIYCLTRAVPPQRETEYFKNIIMDVVMQGGEADTNATVVGAMLGARFGYSQLPTEWVVGLKRWEWLEDRIDEFCALL
jgi:ADP-ribosylglycohydrolase